MYPTEKEWDELSPKEKEQSNFEFFKAQLVLRDKYLKEYEGYLVKKSKEIGLQDYSELGELCFVLSKRNDLDDTGDPWCRTYFTGALYYKIFNPIYRREDKMRCLEILIDLSQTPLLMEKLDIDLTKLYSTSKELMNHINDIEYQEDIAKRPKRWTDSWLINRIADDLFIDMNLQIDPQIRAKDTIPWIRSIYADYKYWDYHCDDVEGAQYSRLDKQRTRALRKSKETPPK